MLPSEAMYPYTAKEARERGELELWRANFRTNCACAGAIELAIRRDFDGMHLRADCTKSVIDQYKALGNSVAIPCVDFVMQCLVQAIQMGAYVR